MSSYEQPLISQWHNGEQIADNYLGAGCEAEVRRRTFQTEQGIVHYAYKPVHSQYEATRIADIYTRLRDANLPVTQFLKTRREKAADGSRVFSLIMEDVSENDRYFVENVESRPIGIPGYDGSRPLADLSDQPMALKSDMLKDLAVIHNLGIFDFHPGISFFHTIAVDNSSNVSFRILDYGNFTHQGMPDGWDAAPFTLEDEMEHDARTLVGALSSDYMEQVALFDRYFEVRDRGAQVASWH